MRPIRRILVAVKGSAAKTHPAVLEAAQLLLDSLPCDLLVIKPPKFSAPPQKRSRGVKFVAAPYVSGI